MSDFTAGRLSIMKAWARPPSPAPPCPTTVRLMKRGAWRALLRHAGKRLVEAFRRLCSQLLPEGFPDGEGATERDWSKASSLEFLCAIDAIEQAGMISGRQSIEFLQALFAMDSAMSESMSLSFEAVPERAIALTLLADRVSARVEWLVIDLQFPNNLEP